MLLLVLLGYMNGLKMKNSMIKTVGELKKILEKLPDDFTIKMQVTRELTEEELKQQSYKYPYEYIDSELEMNDIGYSDKVVIFNSNI